MFILDCPDLPEIAPSTSPYGGGALCELINPNLGTNYPPLAVMDYSSRSGRQGRGGRGRGTVDDVIEEIPNPVDVDQDVDTIIVDDNEVEVVEVNGKTPIVVTSGLEEGDRIYVIEVDESITQIHAIVSNGVTFLPAADPSNPQPGEFVFDPYLHTVAIYADADHPLISGFTLQIVGQGLVVPTLQVSSLPDFLRSFPLEGKISIRRRLEDHPEAALVFTMRGSKVAIQRALAPGTELELYGIGFRVETLTLKETSLSQSPVREFQVNCTLSGKWKNYYEKPISLNPVPGLPSPTNGLDLSCATISPTVPGYPTVVSQSLQTLASLINVPLEAPTLPYFAKGTAAAINTTTLSQELPPRVRQVGGVIHFSDNNALKVLNWKEFPTWSFTEAQILDADKITTNARGIARPIQQFQPGNYSPWLVDLGAPPPAAIAVPPRIILVPEDTSVYGYAAEYANVQLTGTFNEYIPIGTSNATGGSAVLNTRPLWRSRPRVQAILIQGDKDPDRAPPTATTLKDLSNVFDRSGPKKAQVEITQLDGFTMLEVRKTWGYAYTARDYYIDGIGPAGAWKLIEEITTTYTYDYGTGYYTSKVIDGWRLARYQQEDPARPQTIDLSPDNPEYEVYNFQKITVRGQHQVILTPLRSVFPNVPQPPSILYKQCLADGTSAIAAVIDPTWVEPMFVSQELEELYAFAYIIDPTEPEISLPDDSIRPKYLTTGEEYQNWVQVVVMPATYNRATVVISSPNPALNGQAVTVNGDQLTPDLYYKFMRRFSAQDANFVNALEHVTLDTYVGRPGSGQRLPSDKTTDLIPPAANSAAQQLFNQSKLQYFLSTPGYSLETHAVGGSVSYKYALTYDEAVLAAQTDIDVKNVQNSVDEQITIAFNPDLKEGDRLTYVSHGVQKKRRIKTVNHILQIKGTLTDGTEVIEGVTQLTLGLDRKTPVTVSAYNTNLQVLTPNAPVGSLGTISPLEVANRQQF